MPANINKYIGRQPAWHNLGIVTGEFMTWEQIAAVDGMNYGVEKRQLEWNGKPVEAWGTFRMDNDELLATVGKDYTVIHHSKGFEMIDALVNSVNGAHYETAGVLGKGETVWGLANLKLGFNVGNDEHKAHLLFATSYGKGATAQATRSHMYATVDERVVCENTLYVALTEKGSAVFRVRHTRNGEQRLADAHAALSTLSADVKTMSDKLNFLAERRVTKDTLVDVLDRLFPKTEKEDGTTYSTQRRDNVLVEILRLFENNDNNAFPEQRGTAYNLLNAVTNYTDHARGLNPQKRAASAMFGSGNQLKTTALEVILESADKMPSQRIVAPVYVNGPVSTGSSLLDDVVMATAGQA